MKKLIAAAGLGAAVAIGSLVSTGTASATTNDAVFLQVLAERGIYGVGGPDYGLIQTGHAVCIDLDERRLVQHRGPAASAVDPVLGRRHAEPWRRRILHRRVSDGVLPLDLHTRRPNLNSITRSEMRKLALTAGGAIAAAYALAPTAQANTYAVALWRKSASPTPTPSGSTS